MPETAAQQGQATLEKHIFIWKSRRWV